MLHQLHKFIYTIVSVQGVSNFVSLGCPLNAYSHQLLNYAIIMVAT